MRETAVKTPYLTINGRRIGRGFPVYIIAEISANHNQDLEQAIKLIEVAGNSGADAVKLQTYTPDTMTIPSTREWFRISGGTLWDGKNLYDLYAEAYTPWEWYPKLKEVAARVGIDIFSTAFDSTSVDFLESMGTPVQKIASFENVDIPLIRKMARTGKPLIISTGMASLAEIEEAVSTARGAGAKEIALLKCTSSYPAPPEEMNLQTIPHLSAAFAVAVGLSDHTMGVAVPVAAVALGACIVEKHFTLSRAIPGPDSAFSLEPHELKEMVTAIRTAEKATGSVHYGVSEREAKSKVFRRSLFVVKDVAAGEVFTPENLRCIRPGHGLHPRHLDEILGRRAARFAEMGTPLAWDLIAAPNDTDPARKAPADRLFGQQVYLRPLAETDTDSILHWRSDPAVSSQLFSERPPTRAEHEAWFASLQLRHDCREFVIVRSHDDRPVGTISLRHIGNEPRDAEFGIMIGDSECRGKGLAREACDLLFQYGFRVLGLQRINLALFSDNASALTLYRRLGFQALPVPGEHVKDGVRRATTSMYLDRQDWRRNPAAENADSGPKDKS
jgi:N-acetylneuraminate synthase